MPPNYSDSHILRCPTVSDAKGQGLPTLLPAHTETMGGQDLPSHSQTLLWVINTSACLPSSFLLHRGELGLHSVNLSLQACLLLHWPTGEQWRGMKEG